MISTSIPMLGQDVEAHPVVSRYAGIGVRTYDSHHDRDTVLSLATSGTLSGAWRIDGSNVDGADCLENPDDALGTDITAGFAALVCESCGGSRGGLEQPAGAPTSQQLPTASLEVGYVRVTFTPTGGSGHAWASLIVTRRR